MTKKTDNKTTSAADKASPESATDTSPAQDQVQGRGAFIVEMTAAGVAVASTVVTTDGRALALPAIFPNLGYALSQIDEMRALVVRHFDQASQIGVQVMAQQLAQQSAAQQAVQPVATPEAATASAN